ncbi:MAG: UvrD-helicase domain-containing protein [Saprospiraceae bacterium]|nr:UvrD-helicase domain-containing protein [Saprospiraceae bacterium]
MEQPSSYLQQLNDVQRAAVTTVDGPVMVIAGPGSGKTRVLTFRIAHLLEKEVYPEQILALTFTNKAAREMKERISMVAGDQTRRLWAGTFHSIFARILRIEAEKIGFPSNFSIYDTDDSKSLLTRIIKEMHLDKNQYNVQAIRARISSAKSNLITPKLYAKDEELMRMDRFHRRPMVYAIYQRYVNECHKAGAMDFDDLLYKTYELFQKNPDGVLDKYRQRFAYVLVDEFQDTNYLQYSIIKKLVKYEGSPRNICIVGDDAQSIYAFRGATIDNILNFKVDFPELQTFKLEQNYRSTHYIVQAANRVIENNKRQIQKKIWTDKRDGQKIKLFQAVSDNEEGRRVADLIVEYKNRHHIASSEIAILYRTNAQSRVFEEYLRRYNIEYRIFGGLSFYQRKEVRDLIAYLRLSVNQRDEEALRRIINYPKRGIGNSSIDKYSQFAAEQDISLWESLEQFPASSRVKKLVASFRTMIDSFSQKAETLGAYEVASHIAQASGILDTLKRDNSLEGLGRLENLTALLDGIKEFADYDEVDGVLLTEDKSLASYLQSISLLTDMDEDSGQQDYVTLMSVHAAKGLEFDAIFVVGLEENIFPSFQSLESQDAIDEERRLFYVAITRARKLLCLSFANSRYRFGKIVYNPASRFVGELGDELVDSSIKKKPRGSILESRGTATVKGNFKPREKATPRKIPVPADFVPAAPYEIQNGMRVRHLKFGEGKVISLDGSNDSRVATIFFPDISNPRRRIMLKFAKLEIL